MFNFSAVLREREVVVFTQAHLRATATLSSLSYDPAPHPAAWGGCGVHPGRHPQAELEFGLCQSGLHWREVPVAAHLQRVPLAMHFQHIHFGGAVWNKSSDVACPTGSAWWLPAPMAL